MTTQPIAATMNAIAFDAFGPASVLAARKVPTPSPTAGEVLIRLSHTSVNPVDWKIRAGYLKDMLPHRFPVIPGWDAAGVVVALGKDAPGFAVGDQVFAYTRLPEVHSGTYAEYIALPASAVAKQPRTLDAATAAGVPLVALTAFQALHEVAHIAKGDKVLVTGGAGGVGSYAVQFAKLVGADVTATASSANQTYLRELGADHTLDYTKADLAETARQIAPAGFDVIFDTVGGEALEQALKLARPNARIVGIVSTPAGGQYHFVYPNGAQLTKIAELFDAGKLQAPATRVRSIKDAAAAQEDSARGHTRGKVVLAIDFQ